MKVVFVSQPMRGESEDEIIEERFRALREVSSILGEEVELLDTYFTDSKMTALECLGESIKLMSHANICYFSRGWSDSRGCMIEHASAVAYEIPRLYDKRR